ncbi:MAG: dihydrolipoamide acetyltransferase family protein [Phycisphaerales bacterium]|jgi:pyruvate/2-oxoglutarate dehydrogenase complex dihydrolipoamide acyltransferase (E2) component
MAHATSKDPNVFLLPDLGEGLAEAELIKWRVEVGQAVGEVEVLAEMETDKALVEVTSPRAGTIAGLHGEPGEVIKVGSPLVTYAAAAGAKAEAKASPEPKPAPKAAAKANTPAPSNGHAAHAAPAGDDIAEPPARTEDDGSVVGIMNAGAAKTLATPAVRRVARDLGVNIDTLKGSGIGGRVMEKDVRDAAARGKSAGSPAPAPRPMHSQVGELTPVASAPAPIRRESAPLPPGQDTVRIPFRGVRRTIANRLRESVNQAVHFTVMDEADVSGLDAMRKKLGAASGEKLSLLPFVASAVCRVLSRAEFRPLNATVDEKPSDPAYDASIIQHRAVHLGIATDTENGLMVPVIRDCDSLGVLEIGRHIAHVAEAARNRSASREQLSGSTFTISNVGSHAGRFATPIINYPECGILAVGRAREGMVVSKGSFRVGLLLPLSLACDHRVVDGALAALALAELVRLLQDPEALLTPARG